MIQITTIIIERQYRADQRILRQE